MEYIKVKPMVYSKVHTKYIKYVYHKIFHSLQIKNQIAWEGNRGLEHFTGLQSSIF